MTSFDLNRFHAVVEQFAPPPRHRFHALLPAKDMIAELRRKGASYETIAELLTQHSLPTCRSAIARFCHAVLDEKPRPKRRASARRLVPPTPVSSPELAPPPAPVSPNLGSELRSSSSDISSTPRSKGPRIANIRLAEPNKP
jgi:hypothetical protein